MKTNIINWFRVNNWHKLSFRYRLVDVQVEGAGNDPRLLNKAFFNALGYLAQSTKGPVSFAYHEGKRYIAVKEDAELQYQVIPGTPLNTILTPVEGQFFMDCQSMDESNLELALRFVESAINWQFNMNLQLWEGGANTFLKKLPLPLSNDIETDIYHGFKFRLVAEDKNNVYICLDLAYRYADKKTLQDILAAIPKERHAELVLNRNFLYMNGDYFYMVKGKSIGRPIDEHQIVINNKKMSVYDYIQNEGKYRHATYKARLDKHSPTFFHGYSVTGEKNFAGAACLAKRIRLAEDDLHKNSINIPARRFMRAEAHIKNYFQQLHYHGVKLSIDTRPLKKACKVFELPSLQYGNGAILNPYENARYGQPLDMFAKRRREFIYKNGIINDTAFNPQHIFFPDNMPLSFGKAVKYYFENGMKQLAPQFPGFTLHEYAMKSAPYAYMVFGDIKNYIEKNGLANSSILLVLPESPGDGGRFLKALHQVLKKELFDIVKIKCVSAGKLKKFLKQGVHHKDPLMYAVPDQLSKPFRSYQSNTLFEYLIINRKWPYALAKHLHHELYIGIDAHEFYAGFCFFFANGEKIVFDVDKVSKPVGSFRNEKINYRVIADKIFTVLSRHLKVAAIPGSIVILRDGKSYGEEEKALENALQRLEEAGLLKKNKIRTGVIDIAKSSAIPVRAGLYDPANRSLVNPASGTHFYLNTTEAFIFNTGYPYEVPGSSNPLHVSYCCGDIDFNKVVEDIFILTQIAFSAPDRPTSLPLPLKLIDTLIRDVAHENDLATTTQKEINIPQPITN